MQKRTFFVALGVPHGADPEQIRPAYRRVVTRYRREIEDLLDEPTEPPARFAVMRTYSERRHSALFEDTEPLAQQENELDRFFGGFVPEAVAPPRARQASSSKDLFVELRLDPREASKGTLLPVHIPVRKRCPTCADQEDREQATCRLCHGSAQVTEDRVVEVTVPPGVENGQTARVAMEDVGLGKSDLILFLVVR